jgi:sec-independent protein translocase protein TatA
MGMPGGTELLIIFGIIVLMFGAKKIPDLAKGIGKGIKNFKAEMKETDTSEVLASTEATAEVKKVEPNDSVAATEAPKTTTTQA